MELNKPQLPIDILDEIIENLADDKETLFSTLLVSRDWCRTTVPVLWRNPFELLPTTREQEQHKIRALLKIYFSYVNKDDLAAVKVWNVKIPKLRRPTTFDYISCMEKLNDRHISMAVNILFPELTDGFAYPIGQNMVCYALIKQMIRRAAHLLEVSLSTHHWSILPNDHIEGFFDTLLELHPKIRKFKFRIRNFGSYDYDEDHLKYGICVARMIPKLKHLEQVEFANFDVGLTEILKTLKSRPKALKNIKFWYCCFLDGRHEVLKDWQNVEELEEFLSVGCHHLVSSELGTLGEKMQLRMKDNLRVHLTAKPKNPESVDSAITL
ncbi:3986_t:CDS:1, partial [Ambispora gerdemannii]